MATMLTNCQNPKNNTDKEDVFFKKIVDTDLQAFKKYDSIHYSSSEYYTKAISLCNSADKLIKSIGHDKLSEDSLNIYTQHLNEYSRSNEFYLDYNELKNIGKPELIFKIRTYQTLVTNKLLTLYKDNFFPMEKVMPLIVPRKTELKMGEKFIADIYLAGNNITNKYIVTINGDTIKYDKDSDLPVFEEIPTSKGRKTINATIHVYHAGLDQLFHWKIKTEYSVK